mmetsp:Transcript_6637/g.15106  ORF Transcript_6637/g.15106 Transcript_6637/m.15106 type:complete len:264 (-) Transcript_6637:1272-2063(-)
MEQCLLGGIGAGVGEGLSSGSGILNGNVALLVASNACCRFPSPSPREKLGIGGREGVTLVDGFWNAGSRTISPLSSSHDPHDSTAICSADCVKSAGPVPPPPLCAAAAAAAAAYDEKRWIHPHARRQRRTCHRSDHKGTFDPSVVRPVFGTVGGSFVTASSQYPSGMSFAWGPDWKAASRSGPVHRPMPRSCLGPRLLATRAWFQKYRFPCTRFLLLLLLLLSARLLPRQKSGRHCREISVLPSCPLPSMLDVLRPNDWVPVS